MARKFSLLKFSIKWKTVKKNMITPTYEIGVCLEKKPNNKKIGIQNQKIFFFVFTARIKEKMLNNEKTNPWWSGKGVPTVG